MPLRTLPRPSLPPAVIVEVEFYPTSPPAHFTPQTVIDGPTVRGRRSTRSNIRLSAPACSKEWAGWRPTCPAMGLAGSRPQAVVEEKILVRHPFLSRHGMTREQSGMAFVSPDRRKNIPFIPVLPDIGSYSQQVSRRRTDPGRCRFRNRSAGIPPRTGLGDRHRKPVVEDGRTGREALRENFSTQAASLPAPGPQGGPAGDARTPTLTKRSLRSDSPLEEVLKGATRRS